MLSLSCKVKRFAEHVFNNLTWSYSIWKTQRFCDNLNLVGFGQCQVQGKTVDLWGSAGSAAKLALSSYLTRRKCTGTSRFIRDGVCEPRSDRYEQAASFGQSHAIAVTLARPCILSLSSY